MKKNPNIKMDERNKRIYNLYKKDAYTYRGLAKLFKVSHPTIIRAVRKEREKELAEK